MLSAFAGILYFDRDVETSSITEKMMSNMRLPKDIHIDTKVLGNVAITVALPKDIHFENDNKSIFAFSGKIFNMNEMDNITDEMQYMYELWKKHKSMAAELVKGDWMFAGFDSKDKTLTLARSWGYSSLYYYKNEDFFAFATHPMAFKGIGVGLKANKDAIKKILNTKTLGLYETCIEGVVQLLPSAYLEINGGVINEKKFWEPVEKKVVKQFDEKEMFDKYIDTFSNAVKVRIGDKGEVGATLSAGLDSSAVSALAAKILSKQDKLLHTWTSVPLYNSNTRKNYMADESKLVNVTTEYIHNLSNQNVDCEGINPIQAIYNEVEYTGKPHYNATNVYWIEEILRKAEKMDCKSFLVGQLGNATVSWTPYYISLFPKKRYFPNTGLKRYLFIVKYRVKWLLKGGFKRFWGLKKISRTQALDDHQGLFDIWYHYGFQYGIEVSDPTMDVDLIDFLLNLPKESFYRDEVDRRLLRLGMKGLLPQKVLFNRVRGHQGADIVERIRLFSKEAENALDKIGNSAIALEILDIAKMREVLTRIINGEKGEKIDLHCNVVLLRGISVGYFILKLEA